MNIAKQKKVLVTGAAGMIGSHLIDALLRHEEYRIIAIDDLSFGKFENLHHNNENPRFAFHHLDVAELKEVTKLSIGVDVIVHLAARKKISEEQSAIEVLTVNSHGAESVLEAARLNECKVIIGSTSDVYGTSEAVPFDEGSDSVIGPASIKRWAYAVSKLYDEQLALAYFKDLGVPVTVLRYFGGFSPRSNFAWSGGHVPLFIDWVLSDQEIIIHGDGSQTRCMGYVDDLISGTILAMENDAALGEIINIGNDEEMSILECAHLIHRLCNTGKPLKLKFLEMQQIFGEYREIMRRVPDLTKANKLLGYVPQRSFEEGLRRTITQRKKHLGLTSS